MSKLKEQIKNTPLIGKAMIYASHNFFLKKSSVTYWIKKYIPKESAFIVQVGSNDGMSGDPIFHLIKKRSQWKALFIEPVPYLFERLVNNYGQNPRFLFEKSAINDGSNQIFYTVKEEAKEHFSDLPSWFDQLGSFNKEHITKHLDGILEPFIEEVEIKGATLDDVFQRNSVAQIELLHIDTEGYDWKVLSQLRLERFHPLIILFEHKHLNHSEKAESIQFLKDQYHIFKFGGDFLCIDKNIIHEKDLNELSNKLKS